MPKLTNPTSPKIVLAYAGDDSGHPSIRGVPARDLSASDVARLVYVRSISERREQGLDGLRPADEGFDEAHDSLRAELLATGVYSADRKLLAERNAAPDEPADDDTPDNAGESGEETPT